MADKKEGQTWYFIFTIYAKSGFLEYLLDLKEQNEFIYDSDQIMEWLWGIANIQKWTWLLDWWTNVLKNTDLCTWEK